MKGRSPNPSDNRSLGIDFLVSATSLVVWISESKYAGFIIGFVRLLCLNPRFSMPLSMPLSMPDAPNRSGAKACATLRRFVVTDYRSME